jgi:hypothetical protein
LSLFTEIFDLRATHNATSPIAGQVINEPAVQHPTPGKSMSLPVVLEPLTDLGHSIICCSHDELIEPTVSIMVRILNRRVRKGTAGFTRRVPPESEPLLGSTDHTIVPGDCPPAPQPCLVNVYDNSVALYHYDRKR